MCVLVSKVCNVGNSGNKRDPDNVYRTVALRILSSFAGELRGGDDNGDDGDLEYMMNIGCATVTLIPLALSCSCARYFFLRTPRHIRAVAGAGVVLFHSPHTSPSRRHVAS
jgi:hypothetical protein